MMPACFLALAQWTHASWLPAGRAPRTERARAQALSHLLDRYPQLLELGTSCTPWLAIALPRPALARLLRASAALSCAHSLCLVVSASAREQFQRDSGLSLLAAVQSHTRATQPDLPLGAPLDSFDRRQLTAAGLAIALTAASGAAQRLWLQLRLPVACVEAAERFRCADLSAHDALALVGDTLALTREEPRP